MGSRNRKPGVSSAFYSEWVAKAALRLEKETIELLDYSRYIEHLRALGVVTMHPKNLLRLNSRRIAEARESLRNANNNARFSAAVRRSMPKR